MAKHESEVHRQRRIAREALREISRQYENQNLNHVDFRVLVKRIADAVLADRCDQGLFADRSQMDLADRKDC